MVVNLTQEQIDFLYGLCRDVEDDYDNYSVKRQKEREETANTIIGCLLNAEDGSVDEKYLSELAHQYFEDNKYEGEEEWECNPYEAYKDGYKQALKDIIL